MTTPNLQNILRIIIDLVKKLGTEKDLVSKEILMALEQNYVNDRDRMAVLPLLEQLEIANEKMENISWLNKHYKILNEFAQVCSKTLNEEILLKEAYEMVSQVMPTDSFYIALYNEETERIHFIIMMEEGKVYPNHDVSMGDNYTSEVIKKRKIIHLQKEAQAYESKAQFGVKDSRSCIFVPVITDDHVKGVISAQSFSDFAYRKEHEELLQIIGAQVINSIETARLYRQIYVMARMDELTGLKNHRAFHEDLNQMVRDKESKEFSLLMIDSDQLKKLNDRFGHDIGDLYLKVLADGIKSICQNGALGYRYAGDEFMIILPNGSCFDTSFAKLLDYYQQHPLRFGNQRVTISISAGAAAFPKHGTTVDELKKSADRALYQAKEQGGNQLVVFEI